MCCKVWRKVKMYLPRVDVLLSNRQLQILQMEEWIFRKVTQFVRKIYIKVIGTQKQSRCFLCCEVAVFALKVLGGRIFQSIFAIKTELGCFLLSQVTKFKSWKGLLSTISDRTKDAHYLKWQNGYMNNNNPCSNYRAKGFH